MEKGYVTRRQAVPIQVTDNGQKGKLTLRDLLALFFVLFKDGHNMATS